MLFGREWKKNVFETGRARNGSRRASHAINDVLISSHISHYLWSRKVCCFGTRRRYFHLSSSLIMASIITSFPFVSQLEWGCQEMENKWKWMGKINNWYFTLQQAHWFIWVSSFLCSKTGCIISLTMPSQHPSSSLIFLIIRVRLRWFFSMYARTYTNKRSKHTHTWFASRYRNVKNYNLIYDTVSRVAW